MTQEFNQDELYMMRALQLAAMGAGHVSPNPMVGAVLVRSGRIIGEGYHTRCGEAHAEVVAIRSVDDEDLLKEATLYVTLEPCSHYGKTPPCSQLIIEKGIPRVVVGCIDPFREVAGRGVKMLREAGVSVDVGVLEKECIRQNRFFMTAQQIGRPYILLKWAQTADGYMDVFRTPDQPAYVISDATTSAVVHKFRSEYDAILVGTRTALMDNPSLTVRRWAGRHPLRIVIDRELKIPAMSSLLSDGHRTVVITAIEKVGDDLVEYVTLDFDRPVIPQLLTELSRRRIRSLLVEGGACLLQSFIDSDHWDEARIEIGRTSVQDGVSAPCMNSTMQGRIEWENSVTMIYRNDSPSPITVE